MKVEKQHKKVLRRMEEAAKRYDECFVILAKDVCVINVLINKILMWVVPMSVSNRLSVSMFTTRSQLSSYIASSYIDYK